MRAGSGEQEVSVLFEKKNQKTLAILECLIPKAAAK
jgi:hypothetical protein